MVRRPLRDDERELFESAMCDSAPLKKALRPHKKLPTAKKTERIGTIDARHAQVPPPQKGVQRTVGIDGNTAERLRRGQLEPQARLDLHGLSERDAHRALVTFVRVAKARKLRLLLVVTGKGAGGEHKQRNEMAFDLGLEMRARGVLRSLTPRWLREPGLVEIVADVREAHRRHGGSGALYVYLRKGEER